MKNLIMLQFKRFYLIKKYKKEIERIRDTNIKYEYKYGERLKKKDKFYKQEKKNEKKIIKMK